MALTMTIHIADLHIRIIFMGDQTLFLKNLKVGYVRTYLIRKQNDLILNQSSQRMLFSGTNQLFHVPVSLSW